MWNWCYSSDFLKSKINFVYYKISVSTILIHFKIYSEEHLKTHDDVEVLVGAEFSVIFEPANFR